jgi:hypothetical protein
MSELRVWWVPQIPMPPFRTSVLSVGEGVRLMDALAAYDIFQFENKVKPDYCNAGGLEVLDTDGEWVDWYDEETGEDDPRAWAASQGESA